MLLVANLDFEAELAAGRAGERPRRSLSRNARAKATMAGTLLRALASDGDTVWLPGDPAGLRIPDLPGLPQVRWIHGPLPSSWQGPTLAWGSTRATAALGTGSGPDPEVAARVNCKSWIVPVRESIDASIPGSGVVRSLEDWERLQEACRLAWGMDSGWVLKGEFSAAGRERVLGRWGPDPSPTPPEAVSRLLRRHGACLLEPWLPRTGDYGCSLEVDRTGGRLAGVHRLLVSPDGRFQGVELEPGRDRFDAWLSRDHAARMEQAAAAVGSALAREGYRGHAGVDFWTYRDAAGAERLNPLGEVNARLTFGLVAQRLARQLGADAMARLSLDGGPARGDGRRFELVSDASGAFPPVTLALAK